MYGRLRFGAAVHFGFNTQNICSGISHFSPQLFAPHTLNEQFPVGHWTLTEYPHARYSGEDRSSGQIDWRPFKQAFSSSEIFQIQIIKTHGAERDQQ